MACALLSSYGEDLMMSRRRITRAFLALCFAAAALVPLRAMGESTRWEELGRAAVRAVEAKRFREAERLLQEALEAAKDSPRAQLLTLQGLIRLAVAQRKSRDAASYADQLVRLSDTLRQPQYRDLGERYRGSARALRLLALDEQAAALEAAANRIELPVGTACGDRLSMVKRAQPLTSGQRAKAAKAVEALGRLIDWTAGTQAKDPTEYAGRLTAAESLAGDYLSSVGTDQDEPTIAIQEAMTCFKEALRAWPRAAQPWAEAALRVREAEHAIAATARVVRVEKPKEPKSRPADDAMASSLSDLPSIVVGGECLAKGMRLEDVIRRFDINMRWEVRWDQQVLSKEVVAGLAVRPGVEATESPYVLLFDRSGPAVGDSRLARISWSGSAAEATSIGLSKRIRCQ
jgi:hypothetical protein